MKGTNEKYAKIGQRGGDKWSRNLLSEFWDPLHISASVETRIFKYVDKRVYCSYQ